MRHVRRLPKFAEFVQFNWTASCDRAVESTGARTRQRLLRGLGGEKEEGGETAVKPR